MRLTGDCRYLAGVLVEGGSGTSAIFLRSLILALSSYPEVLCKAQEEIDAIVGHERVPTLADYDSLPYIRALVQEVGGVVLIRIKANTMSRHLGTPYTACCPFDDSSCNHCSPRSMFSKVLGLG